MILIDCSCLQGRLFAHCYAKGHGFSVDTKNQFFLFVDVLHIQGQSFPFDVALVYFDGFE